MVNAIKSIDAFFSYRDNLTANTHKQTSILVCAGGGCLASGSLDVSAAFREEIKKQNIADHVMVIETGCQGLCAAGPVVTIQPDNVFYENVSTADVPDIIKNHIMNGKVVERLVHKNPATGQSVPKVNDIDFFKKQTKIGRAHV